MERKSSLIHGAARLTLGLATGALAAGSAFAAGDAPVPEPDMLSILALALAGVLIGRRLAKRKPPAD